MLAHVVVRTGMQTSLTTVSAHDGPGLTAVCVPPPPSITHGTGFRLLLAPLVPCHVLSLGDKQTYWHRLRMASCRDSSSVSTSFLHASRSSCSRPLPLLLLLRLRLGFPYPPLPLSPWGVDSSLPTTTFGQPQKQAWIMQRLTPVIRAVPKPALLNSSDSQARCSFPARACR